MRSPGIGGILLVLALGMGGPASAQVAADAAQALAKRNDCFKCHAVDKTKKGPAYKRIAARLKTKPDAVEVIVQHVTTGPMIELPDGSNENHKIIDTRDPAELRNLALWILSL
ncbi:MAG: cytochrome C [Rhodocyclales bacterium]|nr:cytochrome C [Rhodocyclales bacterium]